MPIYANDEYIRIVRPLPAFVKRDIYMVYPIMHILAIRCTSKKTTMAPFGDYVSTIQRMVE